MKRVSTVAVVYQGKLLMGTRRDNKKETTPGGHDEPGETFLAGGVRELREESGIVADPKDLKEIGHSKVTKPDGEKLEVTAFLYEPKTKPATSMRADPDVEVRRWRWVDISRGLPHHIAERLHVPLEHNVLMKGLGVKLMEKTAFWDGFEKQAMIPTLALPGAALNAGKSLIGRVMGSRAGQAATGMATRAAASPLGQRAAGLGQRAAGAIARNPVATAAGAGAAGVLAGRVTAPRPQGQAGPAYPY